MISAFYLPSFLGTGFGFFTCSLFLLFSFLGSLLLYSLPLFLFFFFNLWKRTSLKTEHNSHWKTWSAFLDSRTVLRLRNSLPTGLNRAHIISCFQDQIKLIHEPDTEFIRRIYIVMNRIWMGDANQPAASSALPPGEPLLWREHCWARRGPSSRVYSPLSSSPLF